MGLFKREFWALGAFAGTFAMADVAADAAALVEIFTAEACEPCRAAEAMVQAAQAESEIVTLVYHVDYWDYLGDPDPLADPTFGARQVAYNAAGELKEIHTPQVILQGQKDFMADEGAAFAAAIMEANTAKPPFDVDIDISEDEIVIDLSNFDMENEEELDLVIARCFTKDEMMALEVDIDGLGDGFHIVKTLESIGHWKGEDSLSFTIERRAGEPLVFFVQSVEPGEVFYAQDLG